MLCGYNESYRDAHLRYQLKNNDAVFKVVDLPEKMNQKVRIEKLNEILALVKQQYNIYINGPNLVKETRVKLIQDIMLFAKKEDIDVWYTIMFFPHKKTESKTIVEIPGTDEPWNEIVVYNEHTRRYHQTIVNWKYRQGTFVNYYPGY